MSPKKVTGNPQSLVIERHTLFPGDQIAKCGFLFSMMLFVFWSAALPPCGENAGFNNVGGSVRASLHNPLPLRLLGGLVGPLGGSGGSSLGGSGPVLASAVPATAGGGSTSEARGGGVPVTSGLGEAGLDGSGALLLNTRELLLLDLLLSLGLRVAV